jgi:hypothetical protein
MAPHDVGDLEILRVGRDYHEWEGERVCLDTAGKSIEDTFSELLRLLQRNWNAFFF